MNNQPNNCKDDFLDSSRKPEFPKKPIFCIGPTGPTDTYDYFFNKINRNYSSLFLINT